MQTDEPIGCRALDLNIRFRTKIRTLDFELWVTNFELRTLDQIERSLLDRSLFHSGKLSGVANCTMPCSSGYSSKKTLLRLVEATLAPIAPNLKFKFQTHQNGQPTINSFAGNSSNFPFRSALFGMEPKIDFRIRWRGDRSDDYWSRWLLNGSDRIENNTRHWRRILTAIPGIAQKNIVRITGIIRIIEIIRSIGSLEPPKSLESRYSWTVQLKSPFSHNSVILLDRKS